MQQNIPKRKQDENKPEDGTPNKRSKNSTEQCFREMSEDGESTTSSTTKSLGVQRPMFNPVIFGTPKRQKSATASKFPSPFLWSQTPPREAESSSNVTLKENVPKTRDDGYYTKDGTFNKWSLSNGAHSLQRRMRMGLYNHSTQRQPRQLKTRIEKDDSDFIMPPSAKEIFATLERLTRPINRDPSHGWMSLREAEKRPIPKPGEAGGPPVGWRTPSKWNRERVGITNKEQLRIEMEAKLDNDGNSATNSQDPVSAGSLFSNPTRTSVTTPTLPVANKDYAAGGGKMKSKMTRVHESRSMDTPSEIEPVSYNLESVPKLNTTTAIELEGPRLCSTPQPKPKRPSQPENSAVGSQLDIPQANRTSTIRGSTMPPANVRYIKVNKVEGVRLFSQPKRRASENSSIDSVTDSAGESSFSFSQPKKITKLSLLSQTKKSETTDEVKQWTPKKRTGDVFVKINYPGFKDKLKTNEKSDAESDHATKLKESETDKSVEHSENAPLTEKKTDDSNQLSFGNLIAKQKKAGWTCDTCMVQNESSSEKCTCCETPNPSNSKPKEIIAEKPVLLTATGGFGNFMEQQKKASQGKWTCDVCMVQNEKDISKCSACETPNPNATAATPASIPATTSAPIPPPISGGFSDFLKDQKKASQGKWSCSVCMIQNESASPKCSACETPNPNATADATAEPKKITFGTSQPTTFGTDSPSTTPSFSFGAPSESAVKETPKISFGKLGSDADKPSAPTFKFGAPKMEEAKTSAPTSTPSFQFGQSATSDNVPSVAVADEPKKPSIFGDSTFKPNAFSFGSKSDTEKPSFSFAPSKPDSTTVPKVAETITPESSAPPSFSFGGSAAPKSDAFSFGGSAAPKAPAASVPTSDMFGGGLNTQNDKPSAPFAFGAAAPSTATAEKPFSFGAKVDPPKSNSPFQFGGKPADVATSTPAPSMFSSSAKKPSFSFTASQPATTSTALFSSGSQSSSNFSFGKPAATQEPASFAFAAPSSEKTQAKPFSFQAGSNQNSSASSMFSPPVDKPSFGAPPTQAAPSFNFNSETKTAQKPFAFGAAQPTQSAAPSGSGLFGNPAATTTQSSSTSIFGASNAAPSNPPPSIFGDNTAKSAPSFNFGGGTGSSSGSMFGSSQPATAPSFQFASQNNTSTSSISQPTNFAPSFPAQTNDQSGINMFNVQPTGTPTVGRRKVRARRTQRK